MVAQHHPYRGGERHRSRRRRDGRVRPRRRSFPAAVIGRSYASEVVGTAINARVSPPDGIAAWKPRCLGIGIHVLAVLFAKPSR